MNTLLNARTRKLHSKVEVVFAGTQIDPTIAVEANNTTVFSQPDTLVNNSGSPTHAWFTLGKNKLDGTFHILPDTVQTDAEIGVWSDALSFATAKEYVKEKFKDIVGEANIKRMVFFDPTTGTVLTDEMGNGNAALSMDASSLNPDTAGSAGVLNFNASGDYWDFADSDDLSFGNGTTDGKMSIVFCGNTNTSKPSNAQTLCGKYDITTGNTKQEYLMYIYNNTNLYFQTFDSSANAYRGRYYNGYSLGDYYRTIIGTYDGSGANTGFNIYENAIKVDNLNANNANTYTAMENKGAKVASYYINSTGSRAEHAYAKYAFLAILSIELTQEQVTAIDALLSDFVSLTEYGVGSLLNAQEVTVTHNPRPYSFISVIGDNTVDIYPEDFTVKFYDAVDTLMYTHTVTGNTQVNYLGTFTLLEDVCKIVLSVTKINQTEQRSRLVEFFAAVIDEYTQSNRIQGFTVLEELFPDSATLSLGQISMNEIDLVLSNHDGLFTPGNNLRGSLLLKNRIIRPSIGVENADGVITWFPLGQFYSIAWKASETESKNVTVVARDRLEWLRTTSYNTGTVLTDKSVKYLFELLFSFIGWTNYNIDTNLDSIVIPYSWFNEMPVLEALKLLCSVDLIAVWLDKNDTVQVHLLSSLSDVSQITFSDSTNIINRQYPSMLQEPINTINVIVNEPKEVASTSIYSSKQTITIPGSSYVDLKIVFTTDKVLSVDDITTDNVNVTGAMEISYCYGGTIRLTNSDGSQQSITELTITGTVVELTASNQVTAQDNLAIIKNGAIELEPINKGFIQTTATATSVANALLAYSANAAQDISLITRGDVSVEVGDAADLTDSTDVYRITRQMIEYDGGLQIQVSGKII